MIGEEDSEGETTGLLGPGFIMYFYKSCLFVNWVVIPYNVMEDISTGIIERHNSVMSKNEELKIFAEGNNIVLIYLFGSMVDKGLKCLENKPVTVCDQLEDLDIGIILKENLPEPEALPALYSRLYHQISSIFEPLKVDLVLLQEKHSVFQAEAVYGKCIYAKSKDLQEEYEENVLRKAADFRPVIEKFYEERLEDIL